MSCCPGAPPIRIGSAFADEPSIGTPGPRVSGESEDCYNKRNGNVSQTGQVSDKTEEPIGGIKQNSVPVKADGTVNTSFTSISSAGTFTFVKRWIDDVELAPGLPFPGETGTAPNLVIDGPTRTQNYGKRLKIQVTLSPVASGADPTLYDRTYTFSPSVAKPTDSFRLKHPLPGAFLTSRFGPRKPPTAGASSGHGGIDFATGKRGSKVLCAADGVVTLCRPQIGANGKMTGYGNYIVVDHLNGSSKKLLSTCYAHLDQYLVRLGDTVTAGQALGIEGNTGTGTGPHLHFEVRLPDGTRVDPLPYLEGGTSVAGIVAPNHQVSGTPSTETDQGGMATSADVAARTKC